MIHRVTAAGRRTGWSYLKSHNFRIETHLLPKRALFLRRTPGYGPSAFDLTTDVVT